MLSKWICIWKKGNILRRHCLFIFFKWLIFLSSFSSCFQNNVEIHVAHIQSGLSQLGNLHAFAANNTNAVWVPVSSHPLPLLGRSSSPPPLTSELLRVQTLRLWLTAPLAQVWTKLGSDSWGVDSKQREDFLYFTRPFYWITMFVQPTNTSWKRSYLSLVFTFTRPSSHLQTFRCYLLVSMCQTLTNSFYSLYLFIFA